MVDIIGWIGAICFSVCAAPQAYKSYKEKSSEGISILFLGLWYVGELFTLMYVSLTTAQLPLIVNYVFNIICILIIIYYWRPNAKRGQ